MIAPLTVLLLFWNKDFFFLSVVLNSYILAGLSCTEATFCRDFLCAVRFKWLKLSVKMKIEWILRQSWFDLIVNHNDKLLSSGVKSLPLGGKYRRCPLELYILLTFLKLHLLRCPSYIRITTHFFHFWCLGEIWGQKSRGKITSWENTTVNWFGWISILIKIKDF